MLDKATVLSTIYTIVDDAMKGSPVIQEILKRPGPVPSLCDSEVVTIALYQELIGEPREDHFFRLHQEQLRAYFPGLGCSEPLQSAQARSLGSSLGSSYDPATRPRCPAVGRNSHH